MNISFIKKAFPGVVIPELGAFYVHISEMKRIYMLQPVWSRTKKGGLYASGERHVQMLGAAKVLCDEFATLTFSEQVEISVSDDQYSDYLQQALQRTGFWKNFQQFLSRGYGLGGGAARCFVEEGKPSLSFFDAESFFPTGWTGDRITEGVFETVSRQNGRWYTLLERHTIQVSKVHVEFSLYVSQTKGSIGNKCKVQDLYSYLPDFIEYELPQPVFCYLKPASSNNIDLGCPLGVSVYANAVDTLKALDTAFDSFHREFILGKKRIIVPAGCIRHVVDPETGENKRYFDADDEAFMAFKTDNINDLQITDNTMELRIDEHVSAINALLNILCFQTGLSSGTLSFDQVQGVKTATEVVSQNSRTERTVKANKNLITEFLESIAHALIGLGVALGELPKKDYIVTIGWPDNIIVDDNTLIDNNVKLVEAGLKSKIKAIMEVQKCDEAEAKKELQRISEENTFSGTPDDWFPGGDGGGGDND